jgi:putative transposase
VGSLLAGTICNFRKGWQGHGGKVHLADHYYHVYNRGCNRKPIFANAGNYLFLLRRTRSFLADYPLSVIAYCLMPNHYHFLLRPEEDGALSPFVQRLFIHLNPVRAGLVAHPGEWPYSNYLEWVERRRGILVDRAFVRQYFSTAADYEAFVMSEVDPSLEQRLQAYYLE